MRSGRLSRGGVDVRRLLEAYRRDERPAPANSSPRGGTAAARPLLLVSACLLGQRVTYRGGSCAPKAHRPTPVGFLVDCLWREHNVVECVPVCPEMDLFAMPSPRPALRLVKNTAGERRLVISGTTPPREVTPPPPFVACAGSDGGLTSRLAQRHPRLAEELIRRRLAGIDGCVLKSRSPSCGVGDARLYAVGGGYEEVDGFFVADWVRPCGGRRAGETPAPGPWAIPLITERQLRFGNDGESPQATSSTRGCGVLSFVENVFARFDARRGEVGGLASHTPTQ